MTPRRAHPKRHSYNIYNNNDTHKHQTARDIDYDLQITIVDNSIGVLFIFIVYIFLSDTPSPWHPKRNWRIVPVRIL